jgi:energy-coupling factor transport system ATP-binding protein
MGNPFISVEDVHFQHPVRGGEATSALNGINLKIEEGEYIAIVGANGSGKTTLARHFNALLLPSRGRVRIQGRDTRDPQNHPVIRASVGMVFQAPEDQIVAAVLEEDIAFGPENLGLPPVDIRARVDEALTITGMHEHRLRPPHLLSAGQMQRAALAGVLAMHPRCIILDETTAMLDPGGRAMVRLLTNRLHREGLTVIVITHLMREAVDADRLLVLKQGQVAFDGPPRQLYTHPADLYAMNLDLPQAARLAEALRPVLPGLPPDILTPYELLKALPVYGGRLSQPSISPSVSRSKDYREAIRVEDLEHIYLSDTPLAQQALSGASMRAAEGSSHGLIGATGSGKSTLLQHLNGLLVPQRGRVKVGAYDLTDPAVDLKAVRRYAGLVFQNPEFQLFEQYVGDEIAYAPRLMGEKETLRQTVQTAMDAVGLDFLGYKDRLTFALSGGEKRKVAVASILAMNPPILLLDEPTAGLDPRSRRDVLERLKQMHAAGKTLVISSHHMEDVAELAEEVTALAGGRDQMSGSAASVFSAVDQINALGLEAPLVSQTAALLRQRGWPLRADLLRPTDLAADLAGLAEGSHA